MIIENETTGEILAQRVRVCDTFLSRGRGLMFRRPLREDEAYLFIGRRESVSDSAIHTFFVFSPIAVVWLDADRRVIDARLARSFRPYFAPARPAQYFLEGHPSLRGKVQVGDRIRWEPA